MTNQPMDQETSRLFEATVINGMQPTVRPRLTVLDDQQKSRIHDETPKILASVGVRIECEAALTLCARTMGAGAIDGQVVRIPAEWVDWALAAAPSTVEIYDRTGAPAFGLPGPMRFGIGVTVLTTWILKPGGRRHSPAGTCRPACAWANPWTVSTPSPLWGLSRTYPCRRPICARP